MSEGVQVLKSGGNEVSTRLSRSKILHRLKCQVNPGPFHSETDRAFTTILTGPAAQYPN